MKDGLPRGPVSGELTPDEGAPRAPYTAGEPAHGAPAVAGGLRPAPPRRGRGKARLLTGVVVLGAASLVVWGILDRQGHVAELQGVSREEAVPQVQLISPSRGPATRDLNLPGNINAWYSAPIYAQVSGYIRKWYKDYGAAVKKGDLLATIEAPGLDQQLATAQADLAVAQARSNLANVTAKRYKALSGTQAVSQQDIDIQAANAVSTQSQVAAAQSVVARYQAMEQFKNVVAPFDGIVTARNTDVGNYVNAAGGNAGARDGATDLFTVADIHEMRVFVSVPQDYAGMLKPGLTATLTLPQFPDRTFKAEFETSAQSFNAQSRTVVTELTVPNPDHAIWPGTYADVHFVTSSNPDILIVPEQSLLFRAQGMQVALVDGDNKVHMQDVKLGLNLGQNVQVVGGLKADDRLINNPSAGELDGTVVHVVPGVPGIAPEQRFKTATTKPKPVSSAQELKIEAARAGTTDQ